MTIKDKDGNVYKLRGPNPLTKNMSNWDHKSVKLINLGWKSETIIDENNPVEEANSNVVNIGDDLNLYQGPEDPHAIAPRDFIKEIENTPVVSEMQIEVINPELETKPVVIEVDNKVARILDERGVEYHCAPVVGYKKITDELYGSSYQLPKYGTAFIFDAVIIDFNDLELQFWCIKEITKDSIVYKRDAQGGERWWRVNQIEAKTGGYLCNCTISDLNPDFS